MERTIQIKGMSCGHCVAGVRRALEGVAGVEVRDVRVGSATVAYDPATVEEAAVVRAITEEGYEVPGSES